MRAGAGGPRLPASLAFLVVLLIAACGTASGVPSGRWIGTLAPAAPDPACPSSRGVADIRDGTVTFAPDEGTWVLSGIADPDGAVSAERSRLGANKRPYDTRLEARWTPTAIEGTYTTPRCSFTVRLQRRA